eukprot:g8859.t1
MFPLRTIAAVALVLAGCDAQTSSGPFLTCEDLQDAFELTKTQDVELIVDPSQEITCDTFTTMSMDSNTLTVIPSYEQCEFCSGSVTLNEIRFEVTGGAKLFWEPRAAFVGTSLQDVNGGAVYVGEGSTARFKNDFSTEDVGVASVADGDFASYQLTAGCIYVDGYFVVEGEASFVRCENSGGGESPPGPGGVMYVGPTGSVLFADTVYMSDVSIIDNEGNNGAGIYNEGKVNIRGDATFEDLTAESGGAIYNTEGAEFRFKAGASVIFNDCVGSDGNGGAVFNLGYLKFSGPALILNCRASPFVVGSTGETRLSKDSVFWGFSSNGQDDIEPNILVKEGGVLTGEEDVSFIAGNPDGCATVYFEDGDVCLD